MSKKRPYRRYTEEFKRDAIRLVEEEGLSVARVARDLGVNVNSIYDWRKKYRDEQSEELGDSELEELKRLRKRVRVLEEEREILKKAAAFFAKESK
jgi:transposase